MLLRDRDVLNADRPVILPLFGRFDFDFRRDRSPDGGAPGASSS